MILSFRGLPCDVSADFGLGYIYNSSSHVFATSLISARPSYPLICFLLLENSFAVIDSTPRTQHFELTVESRAGALYPQKLLLEPMKVGRDARTILLRPNVARLSSLRVRGFEIPHASHPTVLVALDALLLEWLIRKTPLHYRQSSCPASLTIRRIYASLRCHYYTPHTDQNHYHITLYSY